jgi:hypothetical protein
MKYQVALFTDDRDAALRLLNLTDPAIDKGILYEGGQVPSMPDYMIPVATRRGALHFVGFKDDRYWNAVKVYGLPDIVHRVWDERARAELAEGDVVIFAQYSPDDEPTPYTWNDSERF